MILSHNSVVVVIYSNVTNSSHKLSLFCNVFFNCRDVPEIHPRLLSHRIVALICQHLKESLLVQFSDPLDVSTKLAPLQLSGRNQPPE